MLSQLDYARALAQGDKSGQAHASEQLSGSVGSLSALLQNLTHGAARAPAVSSALGAHVRQLLGAADAYHAKDYPRAYALERRDYRQMMGLGRMLAAATVTSRGAKLPADFDSPVSHLQSALGGLLGEHFELTVDAVRAGFSRSPEFPQTAALLNGNTQDLTSAFDVLFGKATADRFMTLWADHVDAMVRYTSGGVSGDKRAQSKAVDALSTFETAFAGFLSQGTQGRLAAPALAQGLRMHDHQLLDQVDAYGAKDYAKAHAVTFQGYQHMFDTAAALATAIGPTVAARLPRGGVSTRGGGTSRRGAAVGRHQEGGQPAWAGRCRCSPRSCWRPGAAKIA